MTDGTAARVRQSLGASCAAAASVWLVLLCLGAAARSGPSAWVSGAVLLGAVVIATASAAAASTARSTSRVIAAALWVCATALTIGAGLSVAMLALGHLPLGTQRQVVWPAGLGIAVAAVAAHTIHSSLRDSASAVLPRLRRRPGAVASRVAEEGSRDVPLEDVLLRAGELLRSSLGADTVQVWAAPARGGGLTRVIALPSQVPAGALGSQDLQVLAGAGVAGRAWLELWLPALLAGIDTPHVRIAAASYQDAALGMLLITRPRGAEPFASDDDVALGETADRLGILLHNRQLDSALRASLSDLQLANDALAASRRRLVTASDTERRRIERDLHDGAQQHLVALAVNLSIARGLLGTDPDAADELLQSMAGQVRDAVRELRDLAHGIYPALLKEGGVEQALRSSLSRLGPNVRTALTDLGRFEPAVEAALYFCCIEAVQNSAKHAPGAQIVVSLGAGDSSVWFSVADDGPGFDPSVVRAGFGQVSMTDRIGALGGTIRWETAPGRGTTVRGQVPVRG